MKLCRVKELKKELLQQPTDREIAEKELELKEIATNIEAMEDQEEEDDREDADFKRLHLGR